MTPGFYRGLTGLAAPFIDLYLARRRSRGKEPAERFAERHGEPGRDRPPGPLIWVHAASMGESLSILPLVQTTLDQRPDLHILLTTGTVTSAAILADRLPDRAFHQFVPVDRMPWVRAFLDHWRPDLAIWVESEFWPNLLGETQARAIPTMLVNGRMSDNSFAGWQRWPGLIRPLLSGFSLCLAQTEEAAQRLAALGAVGARHAGNLKYAADPPPADAADLARLRDLLGDRPRWLAASTHEGEEEQVAAAHRHLSQAHSQVLTILVPRHATRGAAIAKQLRANGYAVARRAAGEAPAAETQIYLADTMGELGLFYRAVDIAFVGKSLVPKGGQNPIEPAQLDCAILHGPDMANFRAVAAELDAAGATETVSDSVTLAAAVDRLFRDPDLCRRRADAARQVAAAKRTVLQTVQAEIAPFLAALPDGARSGGHART